jgi:hypothetical protein
MEVADSGNYTISVERVGYASAFADDIQVTRETSWISRSGWIRAP